MNRWTKWLLFLACSLTTHGYAAEIDSTAADSSEKSSEPPSRVGVFSNEYTQDGEVAAAVVDDEVFWLEESLGRVLVLHRSVRRGSPRGSVILLSGPGLGSSGSSHVAYLRSSLALHGWNTYFVRLPEIASDDTDASSAGERRVEAAVALVRERTNEGLVLLIAEASASRGLGAGISNLGLDGLILLNLTITQANKKLLKDVSTPTFLLQEQPATWGEKHPLADNVELQQLPRSNPRQDDGRLLRRIRGWLKRRYG